jgi:hypothetical protein
MTVIHASLDATSDNKLPTFSKVFFPNRVAFNTFRVFISQGDVLGYFSGKKMSYEAGNTALFGCAIILYFHTINGIT